MTAEATRAGSFAVVTDSTADIPPEMAAESGVIVVPVSVCFGAETFPDGQLTQQEFFKRMKSWPTPPTTSQPPTGAFVDAYERALKTAESVLAIHISSRLSGTIETARTAAQEFAGKVHIVDSLNVSWGLAFQVMDAASSAIQGLTLAAAVEHVERVRRRVHFIVGLDSLENLAKGGRIGKLSAFLGSLLNLKIMLEVDQNSDFQPLARLHGEKAALQYTLDWVAEHMGAARKGAFAVGYALFEERAQALADALRERYDVTQMVIYPTGPAIATHSGTAWGVVFVPEE